MLALLAGCLSQADREVVVYTALDAPFSQPILDSFEQKTGIRVRAKFDVESTKTVGLANAILAEAERPRCDVFWNNEILNTLRLKRKGLLAPLPQARNVIDSLPPSLRTTTLGSDSPPAPACS